MKYYSVYDNLGEKFYTPVLFQNENVAKRWFAGVVNNEKEELISKNPQDFSLYKLAEFDERTGNITSEKEKICDAIALKKGE